MEAIELLESPGRWEINAHDDHGPSGSTTFVSSDGNSSYVGNIAPGATVIQTSQVIGNINMSHGDVFVGGRRIHPAGHAPSAPAEPVRAEVEVPARVALSVINDAGTTRIAGPASTVNFKSASGSLHAGQVADLKTKTVSGSVTVTDLRGTADLTSVSGSVEVAGHGLISTTTVSGPVSFTPSADSDLRATTVSGDITVHPSEHRVSTRADVGGATVTT